MHVPHAKVIVNPAAGGYSIRREWPRIRRQLKKVGLSFDYEKTEGKGHAREIVRADIDNGYRYFIAVGGDGTVNEVVNGILSSPDPGNTLLGVLSAGTACSFVRSLGIPRDYAGACSLLTGQGRTLIDVGVVECRCEGKSARRFFVNEADVGFGAAVVEALKDIPGHLGRSINYAPFAVAGIKSLFSYTNKPVTLNMQDRDEVDSICAMVVIANGCYFGGGMCMAPHARINDGLLDIVIIDDVERSELLNIWLMSYEGSHITHPKVRVEKVSHVAIRALERVPVEADGELVGECPVVFSVIPSALTVVT